MPTYDQQDPKVENQTNVAGNVTGGDVGDGDGGINRAIITGRDVIRSILVTGDHNRVFVGNYEPLEKIYKEPWQVFERTSRLPFTGREWLLDEVDAFLNRHDRGYFILEASAGLGKTAFLAWLAKERGYIHHFCELTPGAEGVGDGLKNLAAQLALAYELEPEGILLVDVASHPSYLSDLLKRAADKRNRNEKIIVVIDALDESDAVRHQNVMGLPSTLPEGIYFIVSQRPTTTTLKVDDPTTTARQYFRFSADDDDNQADMRRFLEYASELPEVVRALQESEQQYTSEQFITTLMQKCRGVWIYLYFVVQEIVQGMRSPLDLAALPDGMTQYYAHYWQRWRNTDEQEWDEVYLPLLTTLAASQEALSCQRLIEWSGSTITERNLRRLLEREWRPFLAIAKQGNQSRYRFYHATLQEFFEGQLAQENLSLDEIEFLEELSDETQKRHNYLVERYLQAWGGMESNLQGLKDAQLRDLDDRYGLRHLAYHLEASGRIHDLHRLLRVEWRRSKTAGARLRKGSKNRQTNEQDQAGPDEGYQNAWFTVQEEIGQTDAYLADVTRAWRLAEESVFDRSGTESTEITGAAEEEWWNECVSLQCRYALIQASLNTHANNIRPGLFVELIKQKIWLPEQGLCYARQVTAPNQRVEMLVALVPFLPNEEHPKILQEALGVARSIKDSDDRAKALTDVAPHFAPEEQAAVLQEALGVARSIKDSKARSVTIILAKLTSRLAELGQPEEALAVAHSIESSTFLATALTHLAPDLAPEKQVIVLQEALTVAHSIESSHERAIVLTNLAPHLAPGEQATVLQEVLAIASTIESSYERAKVLANLAPHFAPGEQATVLQEALTVARFIESSSERTKVLADLAPHLASEEQATVLQEALTVARSIESSYQRTKALATLVPCLAELGEPEEALAVARSIEDREDQTRALANLASGLAKLGQTEEALVLACSIEDSRNQADTLATLVHHLAELKELQEALTVARSIEDSDVRTRALADLASHLAPKEQTTVLQEALTVARSIEDSDVRTRALADLASHLAPKEQTTVLQEALTVARSIENSRDQAEALATLALRLAELGQTEEALAVVRSIENSRDQAEALATLALRLAELGQTEEALAVARSIEDSFLLAKALANLALHIAPEQLQEALTVARSIEDSYVQADALANLAPHLAPQEQATVLQEALTVARSIKTSYFLTNILATLVPHLALEHLQEALTVARSIKERLYQADTLANLALRLATLRQSEEAFEVARSIKDSYAQADALANIASHLIPEEQATVLQEALAVARSIESSDYRADALVNLIPHLALEQLQEVLGLACTIEHSYFRARVLATLAPHLALEQLQEALAVAHSIEDSRDRTRVLTSLTSRLAELEQLQEALVVARSIENSKDRADALTNLIPHLALEHLQEALVVARSIENSKDRADALANLEPHLAELSQAAIYMLWGETLNVLSSRSRVNLLADLAALSHLITCLGGFSAARETAQAIVDIGRWWP